MSEPVAAPATDGEAAQAALADLVAHAHLAAPHDIAALIDRCARRLGARSGVAYLADLQQQVLSPFVPPTGPGDDALLAVLDIDTTMAGRAYQFFEVQLQESGSGGARVWLPLLVGTERQGVLCVELPDAVAFAAQDGALRSALEQLAAIAAGLVVAKAPYGDTIVQLRRRSEMGLAAEIQWSLLPPLTFASRPVTVAAALEPAYSVAGDTIDYAVDAGRTRVAIFDVMGHGLHSAQCAVLAVASYRRARRSGLTLPDIAADIEDALREGLGGEIFCTAVLADLDTVTGAFQWANAGHPEPLLLRAGRVVKTLQVEPRPPLGLGYLRGDDVVAIGHEQLEPGDRILFYTDGVSDARSPSGEFFGADRLADLVLRHLAGGLPAPETMRRVIRELLTHHDGQLSDDASLLLLEWLGGGEEALRM